MGCLIDGRVFLGECDFGREKVILVICRRFCVMIGVNLMSFVRISLGIRINSFVFLYLYLFNRY